MSVSVNYSLLIILVFFAMPRIRIIRRIIFRKSESYIYLRFACVTNFLLSSDRVPPSHLGPCRSKSLIIYTVTILRQIITQQNFRNLNTQQGKLQNIYLKFILTINLIQWPSESQGDQYFFKDTQITEKTFEKLFSFFELHSSKYKIRVSVNIPLNSRVKMKYSFLVSEYSTVTNYFLIFGVSPKY